MNKKLLWIIIGVVVLLGALFALKATGKLGKEEGTKVSAEKVEKRTIIELVNASGKVFPEVEVKVSSDISGEIVELTVEEGDSVQKGQVLARIYADIYATQRDQATAAVNQQQSAVANSEAQLEALRSGLKLAQDQYNRQKKLLEDKVISRAEFEQAENNYQAAQANYNAAVQGIKGNMAGVQSARANLQRANKDLSRTTIVAPMSGIVSLLPVKKGERVVGTAQMSGTEMMRIADMGVIEVQVDVSENDIPKVHLGDSALVEVDAYSNRKFKGLVTQIASSNNNAGQAQAATANDITNYKVHIRLLRSSYQDLIDPSKSKSFPFRPGMSASADIQTKRHVDVLSVPINAVTTREKGSDVSVNDRKSAMKTDDDKSKEEQAPASNGSTTDELEEVVYVLQPDNTVKKIVVKTDIQDINHIEVTSGLKAGDQVITGPYTVVSKLLKSGTKVKVVPKEQLFETKK
jgi:HlyD family secretion protein